MKFKDLDGLEYEFDNISGAIYQSYDYIKEPLPNSDRIIENQKEKKYNQQHYVGKFPKVKYK